MKNNLKTLRTKNKLTLRELGQQVNINFSTIAKLEKSLMNFSQQHLEILTEYFGVTADYLLGFNNTKYINVNGSFLQVPVVDEVINYKELLLKEDFNSYLPANVTDATNFIYYLVKDNSMEPTFKKDDFVLIQLQEFVNNGDTVLVTFNKDTALLRRFEIIDNERFLFPDNEDYPKKKLETKDNPKIIGVVKGLIRPSI